MAMITFTCYGFTAVANSPLRKSDTTHIIANAGLCSTSNSWFLIFSHYHLAQYTPFRFVMSGD